MKWPELPEEWSHKPAWCPPFIIPFDQIFYHISKKSIKESPPKPYYFFDTPDYEDCHKKAYFVTNYGLKAAAFVSTVDLLSNKQLSYSKAFGRVGTHFGRIGGSSLLYASVTCAVANMRGNKDDELNHIIGGASVGLIWGYKYHSTAIGSLVAAGMALFGYLLKRSDNEKWQLGFPANIAHTRVENGTLGGQNYGDLRIGWKLEDPGRKSLE